MSERSHSYLSEKCEVRLTADRGGHTVVAKEPIAKGELIVVWSGALVDGEELATLPASVKRYSLQVEENHYLVSLTDCEPPDYVNHSCMPNAGLSGQITLVALRDIRAGEEITYDYAMSDGSSYDEFQCGCGSPLCRGRVSGDDWRRPELWERYEGFFSPYLHRRIVTLQNARAAARKRLMRNSSDEIALASFAGFAAPIPSELRLGDPEASVGMAAETAAHAGLHESATVPVQATDPSFEPASPSNWR